MSRNTTIDFPLSGRPIVGFTGPFGSGKTEVAIGYALASHAQGRATCIVDLDVVTPYFRIGGYREQLLARGLRVVAPQGALALFEVPALSPEVVGAVGSEDMHVVLDVGGDPVGSQLLTAYSDSISARGYDLWMVVNPFRPSSSTPDRVVEHAREIENASSLRLTGIVANPHLGAVTDSDHLHTGWKAARRAAEQLQLPVVFFAVADTFLGQQPSSSAPVLPLHRMVQLPWESM